MALSVKGVKKSTQWVKQGIADDRSTTVIASPNTGQNTIIEELPSYRHQPGSFILDKKSGLFMDSQEVASRRVAGSSSGLILGGKPPSGERLNASDGSLGDDLLATHEEPKSVAPRPVPTAHSAGALSQYQQLEGLLVPTAHPADALSQFQRPEPVPEMPSDTQTENQAVGPKRQTFPPMSR